MSAVTGRGGFPAGPGGRGEKDETRRPIGMAKGESHGWRTACRVAEERGPVGLDRVEQPNEGVGLVVWDGVLGERQAEIAGPGGCDQAIPVPEVEVAGSECDVEAAEQGVANQDDRAVPFICVPDPADARIVEVAPRM